MKKIKVLLIEDNRLLRHGTTTLLNEQEDIQAESSPGNKKALEAAKRISPDVVLLDFGLKSKSSLKVLEAIRAAHPKTEVVVMDLLPAYTDAVDLIAVGVSGFVPRDATLEDLLHTIRSVVKGVKILPSSSAGSLFSHIVERAVQSGTINRVIDSVKLTEREQAVVNMLADGKSVVGMALLLKITDFSVKVHIRNIMDKLALHTRLELTSFARSASSSENSTAKNRKNLR